MSEGEREWQLATADDAAAERIAAALGLPQPMARLLVARGWATPEAARAALADDGAPLDDPEAMPGLPDAAAALADAIRLGRRIAVYGDFDVDGVTATALMVRALRTLGAEAAPFLPRRLDDGYGLTVAAARRCIETTRPNLIVTVDCGTHSDEAVRHIRRAGVDILITDHHHVAGAPAPATAVVNPRLGPPDAPWRDLSGVGVAFKLAVATAARLSRPLDGVPLYELAALGTVADCVALRGENRTLVRRGLAAMNAGVSMPGLEALRQIAGIGTIREAGQIAYALAPRLNAAGRLDTADIALELLMTDDHGRAVELAGCLDRLNRQRQRAEESVLTAAEAQAAAQPAAERAFAVVVAGAGWHAGVIGIVAARLAARHHRPAVVIATGETGAGRGSCRGIDELDLVAALGRCADVLRRYGGHAMAAGLDIEADRIPEFRRRFNEAVADCVGRRLPAPVTRLDAWIGLVDADLDMIEWIRRAGPYGHGHLPPTWGTRRVEVVDWRIAKERHAMMRIRQAGTLRRAVAFQQGHRPPPRGPIDVAFQLQPNEWRGTRSAELRVVDWRPAE